MTNPVQIPDAAVHPALDEYYPVLPAAPSPEAEA